MRPCLIFFLSFLLLLASCVKNSQDLLDGYYTAETSEFDTNGWKEYLTICVSGGQIILVEYDSYNSSGFIKSWDMDYMRTMNEAKGTYPNAYSRYFGRQLIEKQGTDKIDVLSGASRSYRVFITLAKAVLENAREGNSKTALVHFGVKH